MMSDRQKTMNDDVTRAGPEGAGRAELEPGTRLGRYEILRLLGRGGMGQVYLARHELQKTLHALKILPSEFSGRAGFLERFQTELQTMARMQHPNIVHVQYSDMDAGLYYFVMDFVASDNTGEPYDLEEALAVEKRFEPEIVKRLMLQLCSGLSFAHGQGVVHRDLKPANVLLTSKNLSVADVKVCDFGLARVIGEEQVRAMVSQSMQRSMGDQETFTEKRRSERSSTGSVLGTYGYMSPEQEEGKISDERSDLYSLGVLMYRMVTGQRLRGRAKAASAIVPGLDKAWDEMIDKCLEYDPLDRWQTVLELEKSLEKSLNSERSTVVVLKKRKSPSEGEPWTSPSTGMEFVWIKVLKMWVGKYTVTNGEYRMKEPTHDSKSCDGHSLNGDRQPVVFVNFDDAKNYGVWLTELEKVQLGDLHYRVISEEEWLECARCGDGRIYPWGNEMPPKYGNYGKTSEYDGGYAVTCPVEKSGQNEWGLYGVGGNVWECCAMDAFVSSFGAWRGAAWGSNPVQMRCTYRLVFIDGSFRYCGDGFRLVLSQPSH